MFIAFCLFFILFILGLVEYRVHVSRVKSIRVRILVNGTRGKTTVSRILIAALNEKGIRTMGRTTGSEAVEIYPDGRIEKVKRKRSARIIEMKAFFKKAKKEKVEAVVVECMALRPENQKVISNTLVKPTHVVITNSYLDHIAEMGEKLEDTIYALSLSVNKDSILFASEDYYDNLGTPVFHPLDSTRLPEVSFPLHSESWKIAKLVLNSLDVDDETIIRSLDKIIPDIGMKKRFDNFYPYFSVNDEECMLTNLRSVCNENFGKKVYVVFNNRADREYRVKLVKHVIEKNRGKIEGIYVIGDYKKKIAFYFSSVIEAIAINTLELSDIIKNSDACFVGLGNIKGKGEELISLLYKEDN